MTKPVADRLRELEEACSEYALNTEEMLARLASIRVEVENREADIGLAIGELRVMAATCPWPNIRENLMDIANRLSREKP